MWITILITLLVFSLSASSSFLIYKFGSKIALVDIPNARSSHSTPIPRGGIGVLLAFIITWFLISVRV